MKTVFIASALIAALFINATASTERPGPTGSRTSVVVQEPATYTLKVVLSDIAQRAGKLHIGIANDEASFNGTSFRKTEIKVPATGEVNFTFEGLPAGKYAVRVFQDLNENATMDFDGQMPTEPFGFSNTPMLMGPPSFNQCVFELSSNQNIDIRLLSL